MNQVRLRWRPSTHLNDAQTAGGCVWNAPPHPPCWRTSRRDGVSGGGQRHGCSQSPLRRGDGRQPYANVLIRARFCERRNGRTGNPHASLRGAPPRQQPPHTRFLYFFLQRRSARSPRASWTFSRSNDSFLKSGRDNQPCFQMMMRLQSEDGCKRPPPL